MNTSCIQRSKGETIYQPTLNNSIESSDEKKFNEYFSFLCHKANHLHGDRRLRNSNVEDILIGILIGSINEHHSTITVFEPLSKNNMENFTSFNMEFIDIYLVINIVNKQTTAQLINPLMVKQDETESAPYYAYVN